MLIALSAYPQLRLIAWNRPENGMIEERDAFALYERNWRYIDAPSLLCDERAFIETLTQRFGKGLLNV